MEKKNTGLIVIIVVMALIIGALGGYIVSNRLINKEPNQSENNDKTTEISITEAETIMSKYKFSHEYAHTSSQGDYYISSLDNENEMNLLAIQWTNKILITNCDDVKEDEFAYFTCDYKEYPRDVYLYKYDDVLSKKKELFGDSVILNRDTIHHVGLSYNYPYISKLDGYVNASCMCGETPATYNSTIVKAFKDDLRLIIELNLDVNYYDNETDNHYYQYVFKNANNRYYLTEINEIK